MIAILRPTRNLAHACSSHWNGKACTNSVRVRRDTVEAKILGPLRDELLAPARVEKMTKETERYYLERVQAMQARAIEQPKELADLTARIARLRKRLRQGDPRHDRR